MLSHFCWNREDALGAALTSRALLETLAMLMDFTRRLVRSLDEGNFAGVKKLATKQTLSTRMDEWVKQYPESRATSIITIIERVDDKYDLEGMMTGYYDDLSERCHPNYGGLLGLFGKINHDTGEASFSDRKSSDYRPELGAMLLINLAESAFDRLSNAILLLAELQQREDGR